MFVMSRPRIVAAIVAALLVLAAVPAVATDAFPDVFGGNPHHDNVGWAADNGVVEGKENGNFEPAAPIRRDQAASMFARYDDKVQQDIDDAAGSGEQGPAGPKGDTGEQGPKGDKGAKGDPGLSNLESDGPYPGRGQCDIDGDGDQEDCNLQNFEDDGSAQSTEKWTAGTPNQLQQSWVRCADGKAALGGGFGNNDQNSAGIHVVTSAPVQIEDGDVDTYNPIEGDEAGSYVPNGWLVEGYNSGDGDVIVRPHVVCAEVAG